MAGNLLSNAASAKTCLAWRIGRWMLTSLNPTSLLETLRFSSVSHSPVHVLLFKVCHRLALVAMSPSRGSLLISHHLRPSPALPLRASPSLVSNRCLADRPVRSREVPRLMSEVDAKGKPLPPRRVGDRRRYVKWYNRIRLFVGVPAFIFLIYDMVRRALLDWQCHVESVG